MKIAIIADIHANCTALQATLNDIAKRGCDTVVCLGDIAGKGKLVNECIELVKDHCDIVLLGNNDEEVIDTSILTPEHNRYLRQLPYCHEVMMSGRLIRMFHAGPDTTYNYVNTNPLGSIEDRFKMFMPNKLTLSQHLADVVIYGHVHVQTMVKFYNRTLVCCGSVGNNLDYVRQKARDGNDLNTTCASYVIIEGVLNSPNYAPLDIDFVQVPYDIDKELALQGITDEQSPLYKELKQGRYRNPARIRHWLPEDNEL
ncbi:MAG: metallophosphoesterase family protein [Erysipelotrichaceae bacterium]|nr:metallophosphoesterase family protein [Erysipelotrichaceae bacterium]